MTKDPIGTNYAVKRVVLHEGFITYRISGDTHQATVILKLPNEKPTEEASEFVQTVMNGSFVSEMLMEFERIEMEKG